MNSMDNNKKTLYTCP